MTTSTITTNMMTTSPLTTSVVTTDSDNLPMTTSTNTITTSSNNIYDGLLLSDTYVRSGTYSNDNYGTETILSIKNAPNSNYGRETFLKFDLINIPSTISSCNLILQNLIINPSTEPFSIYISRMKLDTWSEYSITWMNKPITNLGSNVGPIILHQGTNVIPIHSLVQEERTIGGRIFALYLYPHPTNTLDKVDFPSRESGNGSPQLVCNG